MKPLLVLVLDLVLVVFLGACEHGKGGGSINPDGGNGAPCGGFGGGQCPANEWCDFPQDDCGSADGSGFCKPRPGGCPDVFAPVCGCDGTIHSNSCEAQAIGIDLDAAGGCPAEVGLFTCGARQCELATEYCQRATSDIGGEPDSFTCVQLPGTCTALSNCDCLANEACGDLCSGDPDDGFTVICPGG